MSTVKTLPPRSEIAEADTWDLSSLFPNHAAWEEGFKQFEEKIGGFAAFRGQLSKDAATLAACLDFDNEVDRLGERVYIYASLHTTQDQANSTYQAMLGRVINVFTRASEAASFIRPEVMAIPDATSQHFLAASELAPHKFTLERMCRYKPHTLGEKEEHLLAMQGEMAGAANRAFRQLLDADMKFGTVTNEKGEEVELGNSTLSSFLLSPSRDVRKTAFHQYYKQFVGHENTLAATLQGSIQKDAYYARARKMGLDAIHHYDTYVPIITDMQVNRTWDDAVELVINSLQPLGSEYCGVLNEGLRGRWCDRYPNQGKQSGAFSCGSFDADPYILMNYQEDVFNDVFTLTHEAGHSMHSYYSASHQPFQYYNYTIFVAEVASTFNEELLAHYMLERAGSDTERAYLINRAIDDIRGTIIRQTMFAEFEKLTHEMVEAGEPLTVQAFKDTYRKLLERYFGPEFTLDDELSLECLRIPHFYRAFYVYKYATGMSAAVALSQRVLQGGEQELQDYLGFLKGGCSQDPLDLLRGAGVDMESPESVNTALQHFESLVGELEQLL